MVGQHFSVLGNIFFIVCSASMHPSLESAEFFDINFFFVREHAYVDRSSHRVAGWFPLNAQVRLMIIFQRSSLSSHPLLRLRIHPQPTLLLPYHATSIAPKTTRRETVLRAALSGLFNHKENSYFWWQDGKISDQRIGGYGDVVGHVGGSERKYL